MSNNLGDTKSIVTHPTTTTHRVLSEKDRLSLGIIEQKTTEILQTYAASQVGVGQNMDTPLMLPVVVSGEPKKTPILSRS